MREVTAMAHLCEESSSRPEVTLSNLRCLMSSDLSCSPPPCPPPSSNSSSTSSSPRPDSDPPEIPPSADSENTPCPAPLPSSPRPDCKHLELPPITEGENISSSDFLSLSKQLHVELPPTAKSVSSSCSNPLSLFPRLDSDPPELQDELYSVGKSDNPPQLCSPSSSKMYDDTLSPESPHSTNPQNILCSSTKLPNKTNKVQDFSETSSLVQIICVPNIENTKDQFCDEISEVSLEYIDDFLSNENDLPSCAVDTSDSDDDSVTSVISRQGGQWDSLSPRAPLAAEEDTDDEEGRPSGAQTRVSAVTASAALVAAVLAVQSEVHTRGSILSNFVGKSCSSEVSSLASGGDEAALLSPLINYVNSSTPQLEDKMRQKASGSSSGSNNEANVQQQQQSSNNNSECPLQCNGMVSECCWNGDCVEARTTQNNLKPAIKLSTEKRPENGKRRVTFNETLNKFFDADYVILVGEDCNGDESTRLVSMCKKSICQPGGNFDINFPELCPFEPPLEYIDQVTLSPPEGYKDVLGAARSAHDDESESESSGEARSEDEEGGVSPVCEQCSACSACASQQLQQQQQQQRYIVETITLTTVTERRIVREANDTDEPRLSGILKGGKLWKNTEGDSASTPSEDGETSGRRSVRFCEDELERKSDEDESGELEQETNDEKIEESNVPETKSDEDETNVPLTATSNSNTLNEVKAIEDRSVITKEHLQQQNKSNDNSELTLTFRLGSSVLLSDKLPANSAVRQLFPDSEAQQRLLGVATSPAATDGESKDVSESDVPSLPSPGQAGPAGSSSDDEAAARTSTQIRRTIERNALRRSLLRCSEPLRRRPPPRNDENSLVERIRQLTCDVDDQEDVNSQQLDNYNDRSSPPGLNKNQPSTYKKLTELFSRRERCHSESGPSTRSEPLSLPSDNSCCWLMVDPVRAPPDFSRNPPSLPPHTVSPTTSLPPPGTFVGPKPAMSRMNVSAEARKQFLSTLGERETPPDGSANVGDRASISETSYSLEDIDDALGECACPPNGQLVSNQPPDVVATAQEQQQRNEPVDELALFVQRDMGRIERIKKRYSLTDDDQDDYGFSRRPSVRGIKPRFGSTTEIIQQIQLQLQPPALACPTRAGSHLTWPYATEPGASSPASSPSEAPPPRRRQPGVPAPRGANGLPVLPEDTYYATAPTQDYRYLEYSTQNGGAGAYMYASTGNLYPRNEMVPYNPRMAQQPLPNCDSPPPCVVRGAAANAGFSPQSQHAQYPAQVYGTVTRRSNAVPAPVHYSNGTLPHPGYMARNGGRIPAMSYAAQPHARSDSPQRMYHRQPPNYYPTPMPNAVVANGRYYSAQAGYPIAGKNYSQQQELPSPSQRTLSPVPAGSPTRVAKFERGAPEGASASPGFAQDSYTARVEQTTTVGSPAQGTPNPSATAPSSVYYAMNV